MKHTKGEWEWTEKHRNKIVIYANSQLRIAMVYKADNDVYVPRNESKANAKLIAAAPKMLDVLQDIFSQVNLADTNMELYKKAKNAIQKATQ